MSLIVITGLAVEARIAVSKNTAMIVGGGQQEWLAEELEAAIAGGAQRLLSFGIAGGLSPRLRAGDLIAADGVCDGARRFPSDAAWQSAISRRLLRSSARGQPAEGFERPLGDAPEPKTAGLFRFSPRNGWRSMADDTVGGSPLADIAGVDAAVAGVGEKAALFAATGAAAVDMESAVVARAAARHGVPFAVLRVIADPADRPLPTAALVATSAAGKVDVAAVLGALARDPGQLLGLLGLAFDARAAFAGLVRVRALLGADFASGDLGEHRLDWLEHAKSACSPLRTISAATASRYMHDMA